METYAGVKMDKIGFLEIAANKAAASRVAVADKGSEVTVTIAGWFGQFQRVCPITPKNES
ncbi:MAG TPA: hypothetical protein VKZ53_07280 [Candidatus Angelobacter sp.]|nr:hypothetical protein [Candidatus Angelobacter sp.]